MKQQRSEEQLYASLQRGMQAASDLTVARPKIEERKNNIVMEGIARFNSRTNPMTEREALIYWARLAENQQQLNDLENVEADGRRAGNKLQS